jgi:hypothetical protein
MVVVTTETEAICHQIAEQEIAGAVLVERLIEFLVEGKVV